MAHAQNAKSQVKRLFTEDQKEYKDATERKEELLLRSDKSDPENL